MYIRNITTGKNLSIIGEIPKLTDDNSGDDGREVKLDAFKQRGGVTVGNTLGLYHHGVLYYSFTVSGMVAGFVTTNAVSIPAPTTAIKPQEISASYDYDGEKVKADFPLTAPLYSTQNITIRTYTRNKASLSYDWEQGIISCEMAV
jgi:hypothetical protein